MKNNIDEYSLKKMNTQFDNKKLIEKLAVVGQNTIIKELPGNINKDLQGIVTYLSGPNNNIKKNADDQKALFSKLKKSKKIEMDDNFKLAHETIDRIKGILRSPVSNKDLSMLVNSPEMNYSSRVQPKIVSSSSTYSKYSQNKASTRDESSKKPLISHKRLLSNEVNPLNKSHTKQLAQEKINNCPGELSSLQNNRLSINISPRNPVKGPNIHLNLTPKNRNFSGVIDFKTNFNLDIMTDAKNNQSKDTLLTHGGILAQKNSSLHKNSYSTSTFKKRDEQTWDVLLARKKIILKKTPFLYSKQTLLNNTSFLRPGPTAKEQTYLSSGQTDRRRSKTFDSYSKTLGKKGSEQKKNEYNDIETVTPEHCDCEPEKKKTKFDNICLNVLTSRNKRSSQNASNSKVYHSNNSLNQNLNSMNFRSYKSYNSQQKTVGSYNKNSFGNNNNIMDIAYNAINSKILNVNLDPIRNRPQMTSRENNSTPKNSSNTEIRTLLRSTDKTDRTLRRGSNSNYNSLNNLQILNQGSPKYSSQISQKTLINIYEPSKIDKEIPNDCNTTEQNCPNTHEENNANALMGSTASTIGKQDYFFTKNLVSNNEPRDPNLDVTEVKDNLEGVMLSNNSILEFLSDFRQKNNTNNL